MPADLYKNNDWAPTITLVWLTADQRDQRVYTAADATTNGTPVVFLSMVDALDATLGDSNSPAWGAATVAAIDSALDGAWKLIVESSEMTDAHFDPFPAGATADERIVYVHIVIPGGSHQVATVTYQKKRAAAVA